MHRIVLYIGIFFKEPTPGLSGGVSLIIIVKSQSSNMYKDSVCTGIRVCVCIYMSAVRSFVRSSRNTLNVSRRNSIITRKVSFLYLRCKKVVIRKLFHTVYSCLEQRQYVTLTPTLTPTGTGDCAPWTTTAAAAIDVPSRRVVSLCTANYYSTWRIISLDRN